MILADHIKAILMVYMSCSFVFFINIVEMAREQTLILVILNVSTYNIIIISFSWENVWLTAGPIVITYMFKYLLSTLYVQLCPGSLTAYL